MKRVLVQWHTTVVTYYETVVELPDDVDLEELDEPVDIWDGNCPLLVAHEDTVCAVHGHQFDEFTRETDSVEVLTATPTGGTA